MTNPPMKTGFSGSYAPEDVTFLLKVISMAPTPVEEKERLIQSGARHYSEMIGVENPPAPHYLELFHEAMRQNRARLGRDLAALAKALAAQGRPVVLASLARAGTPVGVLLQRALRRLGISSDHYSVSIIRGRGIDRNALNEILCRHAAEDVVFVDGWTGKGAIAAELSATIREYNQERGVHLPEEMCVVADLAGVAGLAATADDYLIPSSILNAVVSGLVSRTILNGEYIGPEDFHGCLYYEHLEPSDLSRWFVDEMEGAMVAALEDPALSPACWSQEARAALKEQSNRFVRSMMEEHLLTDRNRVKPGIGESTRSLLRRVPDQLILKDPRSEDVRHLVYLAEQRGVPVSPRPDLEYRAAVIIKSLGE